MRAAAVYVIVLMLPLAFAAMVWPARRIWAIRAVELLAALIVSKFAIVAVLSLGGAALSSGASVAGHSLTAALAGVVLLIMGAFAPWALLRLLPLAEIAGSAAGSLRSETRAGTQWADGLAAGGAEWAVAATARMREDASGATPGPPTAGDDFAGSAGQPRPQGGQGVATQGVDEAQDVDSDPDPEDDSDNAAAEHEDAGVSISDLRKDEHRGIWRL
jgi:hypothetical protein